MSLQHHMGLYLYQGDKELSCITGKRSLRLEDTLKGEGGRDDIIRIIYDLKKESGRGLAPGRKKGLEYLNNEN